MEITKEILTELGFVEKGGVMVLFVTPRFGYKQDGTLIIGYHEHPEKVTTVERLTEIIAEHIVEEFKNAFLEAMT